MTELIKLSYKSPPLFEVAASVQFVDIEHLHSANIGALWSAFGREQFPTTQDMMPMAKMNAEPNFLFSETPGLPRIWFNHKDGNRLIQFQPNRFIYNWKKDGEGRGEYPLFPTFMEEFKTYYLAMSKGLDHEQFEEPKIEMLDLSYVNVVPLKAFGGYGAISKLFNNVSWQPHKEISEPTKCYFGWQFTIPETGNILRVNAVSAQNKQSGEEVMKIEFNIIGQSPSGEFCDKIMEWYCISHNWIAKTFLAMIQENMHKMWGRE